MSQSDRSKLEIPGDANSGASLKTVGEGGGAENNGATESYATMGMNPEIPDPEPLIKNIWTFIYGYTDPPPPLYLSKPLLQILRQALALLRSEPTVIDLQGVVTIIGGVHGHGDSLIAHLTHATMPPTSTFVFLGNYIGQGFAPHECLFLLLALKVKFPKHVYLLKGSFEHSDILKAQDFIGGLHKRGLMHDVLVWCYIEKIMDAFPLAVILNHNYLLIPGGIGAELLKGGIKELRKVERPPILATHVSITLECQWACLILPGDDKFASDGSPTFTEDMVSQFCAQNNLRMIIRSRQLVVEGILNFPEQMITLWTPVSYLDSFRNVSTSLTLNGENHKALITRYKTVDEDPKSLDEYKPPAGRNAITLE